MKEASCTSTEKLLSFTMAKTSQIIKAVSKPVHSIKQT